jgi:hypothetical protein
MVRWSWRLRSAERRGPASAQRDVAATPGRAPADALKALGIKAPAPRRRRLQQGRAKRGQLRRGQGRAVQPAARSAAAAERQAGHRRRAWWKVRRPQIVDLYRQRGARPRPRSTPPKSLDGGQRDTRRPGRRGGGREALSGVADNSATRSISVKLDLLLVTPETASNGRPADSGVRLPRRRAVDAWPSGAAGTGQDWRDLVIARGWAYAILDPTSVQADDPAKLSQGIIGLANRGHPR